MWLCTLYWRKPQSPTGHQGAEDLSIIAEIGICPDPDPDPDLRIPRRRMIRDMDMPTGSSGPVTNLGRESSLKVAVAPLTRSRSQINLRFFIFYLRSSAHLYYRVSFTIVNYFVVVGRFREFELTEPSQHLKISFFNDFIFRSWSWLSSFNFIISWSTFDFTAYFIKFLHFQLQRAVVLRTSNMPAFYFVLVMDFLCCLDSNKLYFWRTYLSKLWSSIPENLDVNISAICLFYYFWTAISSLCFVARCFLLDSLWVKIRQLYSLLMAKKAEFGLWMNWGIKEYFQYVILFWIHL